jgi:hypothetical protein
LETAKALKPLGEKLSFDLGTEPPWEDQFVHLKFPWD